MNTFRKTLLDFRNDEKYLQFRQACVNGGLFPFFITENDELSKNDALSAFHLFVDNIEAITKEGYTGRYEHGHFIQSTKVINDVELHFLVNQGQEDFVEFNKKLNLLSTVPEVQQFKQYLPNHSIKIIVNSPLRHYGTVMITLAEIIRMLENNTEILTNNSEKKELFFSVQNDAYGNPLDVSVALAFERIEKMN